MSFLPPKGLLHGFSLLPQQFGRAVFTHPCPFPLICYIMQGIYKKSRHPNNCIIITQAQPCITIAPRSSWWILMKSGTLKEDSQKCLGIHGQSSHLCSSNNLSNFKVYVCKSCNLFSTKSLGQCYLIVSIGFCHFEISRKKTPNYFPAHLGTIIYRGF